MLGQIGTLASGPVVADRLPWLALLLGFGFHFLPPERVQGVLDRFVGLPAVVQGAVYTGLLVLFTAMSGSEAPFIYLQF